MDEAKLKSLKSTRGSIKGQMTKLHNYVLGTVDKKDIDGFQSKLARAKVLLKQFEDVENSIFDLDPENDSSMIDFSEQYYVVESRFNRYIRDYNAQNPDETLPACNTSMNVITMHSIDVKLPKINIEPFSGQYTEWQSFYDLYVKTIHENNNLSPAQKFQYLKGFLKGEAYSLLNHIAITESNYFEAFRKLCARYDRKKHTIKAFIRSFMDQPAIHQANAVNIRKLLDTSDEVVRGLKALGKNAESRDVWLIHLLEEKLDAESRALWAQASGEEDILTLTSFFKFLLNRPDALESSKPALIKRLSNPKTTNVYVTTEANMCPICKTEHSLLECKKFQQFSVMERRQCIKSDNRCFKCLRINHPVFKCLARSRCDNCRKKHHTLLHKDEAKEQINTPGAGKSTTVNAHSNILSNCILPTAIAKVVDENGFEHECRVMLDSGSMSTFITEKFCNRLKIPRRNNRTIVSGISGSGSQVTKGIVTLTLRARYDAQKQIQVDALIMAKLCAKLPAHPFNTKLCNVNVFLADPDFNKSHDIDMILGVQHVFNILLDGRIRCQNNIIAIETIFGWVLGGELELDNLHVTSSNIAYIDEEQHRVDDMLKLFWEIEAVRNSKQLTIEEEKCERLFVETTQRTKEGRFVVHLPFRKNINGLGNSLSLALCRQKSMERKFQKDATFRKHYSQFMHQYQALGHMVEIQGTEVHNCNYLPHHGIMTSSKFRVVFDASAKTSTGVSLNEILMVGPTVQSTLFAILVRFRLHKIAISADVEKMYRQILVREEDRKFQAIVWRSNDKEPIKYFKLTTLTYGTAAAPYLAMRVLNELAHIHRDHSLATYTVFRNSTYMDDLMTGAETVEKAVELKNNLAHVISDAGMKLRKWVSNSDEFLHTTPLEDRTEVIKDFLKDDTTVKVLGLLWNPKPDVFSYRVNMGVPVLTKRKLLSESSQIFDRLGWLSPIIIKIIILFQTLWLISLDWDEELPQEVKEKWLVIREQLPQLEEVQIERWLHTPSQNLELHGFCDASERSYAAVVYMRHKTNTEQFHCSLLVAKSKVAPVKKLSIARLELCGAHLLANLIKSIIEIIEVPSSQTFCWTDSTIVLDWLSDVPVRWQTFVGNRTSQILEVINRDHWYHVPTKKNPADCASRGILPSEIITHELWWNSPSWLRNTSEAWPEQKPNYSTKQEEHSKFRTALLAENREVSVPMALIERMSSYKKIIETVAIVQRFQHNVRKGSRKQQIQNVVRKCLKCFRAKPVPLSQETGNLPACRVQLIRAFLQVGIDFAGPIQADHKRGRGQKPFKTYICLFVCTSTRPVHIELTTELTTNAFLAALKRESITWHFNPPNAPHFGGLWEAAVKSMKHHLKRVVGETILTVEELQTLLIEIEAILNSRPICALPTEGDIDVLTPAHFIVGHPLVLVPEVNVMREKLTKLNRWEMLHQMRQHIWQKWHIEYLTTLQSRSKWILPKPNIHVDDLVLVMDRNLPPTKWLLGRIIEVFPGNYGLIRVASVRKKKWHSKSYTCIMQGSY